MILEILHLHVYWWLVLILPTSIISVWGEALFKPGILFMQEFAVAVSIRKNRHDT